VSSEFLTWRVFHVRVVLDADGDGADDLAAAVFRLQVGLPDAAIGLANDLVVGIWD